MLALNDARTEVQGFSIEYQGVGCTGLTLTFGQVPGQPIIFNQPAPQSLRIPVQDGAFAAETTGGMGLAGKLTGASEAEGTLTIPLPHSCAGTVTWTVRQP